MIKSWMDNPAAFLPKPNKLYPISWFREPFSLLEAMLCRLYGLLNCIVFKLEWVPLVHNIITTGESFKWAQILLVVMKEAIEKYQKSPTSRNPFSIFMPTSWMCSVQCFLS